mgnify:FL=1|tara:strand:+ start:865 stop:1245 length:381 start_codon:yes stop_codon:yes gene_type:complete
MKKKIILFIIVLAGFLIIINYIFPEHRSIETEKPLYSTEANLVFKEFIDNLTLAELKYLDQTIAVTGVITSLSSDNLTINNRISCKFDSPVSGFSINDSIAIKGRCLGFDDLLEEIKLDQCSSIKF